MIFTNYNVSIRHKVETKQMSLDWVGDSVGGGGGGAWNCVKPTGTTYLQGMFWLTLCAMWLSNFMKTAVSGTFNLHRTFVWKDNIAEVISVG